MSMRVLAVDVDGVLTDGAIYLSEKGEELLRFDVRDGAGIVRWMQAGRECVWVSARCSVAVTMRAHHLGVRHLIAGVHAKADALESFLAQHGYCWHDVVYIGDDAVDLDPIRRAGLGVAVADAAFPVREAAGYVTTAPGGRGAVREVVDMILGLDAGRDETTQTTETSSGLDGGTNRSRPCPQAP